MAINFPIVTTFDNKAIKKADDAFAKLGKTFIGLFSVQKVYAFGKASIQAFADSQKEAQLLATQLNSINLGFASPYLNEFIDKLALATGKTGGELTSAFIALSQATGDATTAQKILQTALDVSMGTGKDLQTVSIALQRAYKGETTALAKLRIGYSTAELKTKSFDNVLKDLQNRFSGAASDAADTFAGKMARLSEAADQAKEAFGERLITALEDTQVSVEELQKAMIDLATAFGDGAGAIVKFADKTIEAFTKLANSEPIKFIVKLLDLLQKFVLEPIVFGQGFGESFSAGDARRAGDERRANEKAASARLRNANALLKAEKKITNEKVKQADKSKILGDINKRFEMDRIQIAAALGGQINEVEKLRLQLMQAILDEDVKRAIILEGQLIKAEAAAQELATLLDSLDEMVGDPFADWPGTIARIQTLLKQLNIKIPIETLFAEKGLKLDQNAMTVTKLERMDVDANNVYINGKFADGKMADANAALSFSRNSSVLDAAAAAGYRAADPIISPAVEAHADALLALAESELALADLMLIESGGMPGVQVNVNVQGSVIAEQDLTATILDNLYNYQKAGLDIRVSSVSI